MNTAKSFKPYYNWTAFNTDIATDLELFGQSFKPYYNWNTFNTENVESFTEVTLNVLNLIITGLPSILGKCTTGLHRHGVGFKPYYNWNTFNTQA